MWHPLAAPTPIAECMERSRQLPIRQIGIHAARQQQLGERQVSCGRRNPQRRAAIVIAPVNQRGIAIQEFANPFDIAGFGSSMDWMSRRRLRRRYLLALLFAGLLEQSSDGIMA